MVSRHHTDKTEENNNVDIFYLFVSHLHISVVSVVSSNVTFQVLTAASMKFRTVFWDVLPCKIIVIIVKVTATLPP
jgi:hypothetical protein